jgi:hypothetical protein
VLEQAVVYPHRRKLIHGSAANGLTSLRCTICTGRSAPLTV